MAKDNSRLIADEIQRRLAAGIRAALQASEVGFRKKVTAEISPPTSDPGQYPHEDTGQGQENIDHALSPGGGLVGGEIEGRWGLYGAGSPIPRFPGQDHVGGEHLQWLTREGWDRLGMEVSFLEDLSKVRSAFRRASGGT